MSVCFWFWRIEKHDLRLSPTLFFYKRGTYRFYVHINERKRQLKLPLNRFSNQKQPEKKAI